MYNMAEANSKRLSKNEFFLVRNYSYLVSF